MYYSAGVTHTHNRVANIRSLQEWCAPVHDPARFPTEHDHGREYSNQPNSVASHELKHYRSGIGVVHHHHVDHSSKTKHPDNKEGPLI